jgi:hypothetical protein
MFVEKNFFVKLIFKRARERKKKGQYRNNKKKYFWLEQENGWNLTILWFQLYQAIKLNLL